MIPYQKQKRDNAIAYFASEFNDRKGRYPTKTWMFKLLALLDFRVLRKTGTPCLGLKYVAMGMGPVPIILHREIDRKAKKKLPFEDSNFCFRPDPSSNKVLVENTGEPDLDFFSDIELEVMEEVLEESTRNDMDLDGLIDRAHEEIRAWKIAWSQAGNNKMYPMTYDDEFENLTEKPADALTPEEDRFLCYRGLTEKEARVS